MITLTLTSPQLEAVTEALEYVTEELVWVDHAGNPSAPNGAVLQQAALDLLEEI